MRITLNGEIIRLENVTNISKLLSSQGYENKMVAIAVNGAFVPRSSYDTHVINDKDEIEIVAPMQGG